MVKIRGKQLKGQQFYRQKILGDYIVDFYCPRARLVIEVDGGQHYKAGAKERDGLRDHYMGKAGMAVLRFSDKEVLNNLEAVLERIWSQL